MRAPERIGIEAAEQFFQSAAVGLTFHAVRTGGDHADDAVFNRSEANVFLVDQEKASGSLQQDFGGLRLLRLQASGREFRVCRRTWLFDSSLARAFCTDCATRFLSNGFSR